MDGCLETDNTVQVLQMLLEQFKSKLENVAKVSMMQLIFSSPTHDWSSLTKPWSFSSETMSLFVHYFLELPSFLKEYLQLATHISFISHIPPKTKIFKDNQGD